jgi:hypothetical protein
MEGYENKAAKFWGQYGVTFPMLEEKTEQLIYYLYLNN